MTMTESIGGVSLADTVAGAHKQFTFQTKTECEKAGALLTDASIPFYMKDIEISVSGDNYEKARVALSL